MSSRNRILPQSYKQQEKQKRKGNKVDGLSSSSLPETLYQEGVLLGCLLREKKQNAKNHLSKTKSKKKKKKIRQEKDENLVHSMLYCSSTIEPTSI